jgi:hypothetical protein
VDAHFLVNAMVATRLISEFYDNRFKFFIRAIENGMSKNMAMVLSMFFNDADNSFYATSCSGHGFIYDVSTKIISRFVNNQPVLKQSTYKEHPSYNRHCDVWDGVSGYSSSKTTGQVLSDIPKYKTVEKINLNIFYKPKNRMDGGYIYHSYDSVKYIEQKVKELLIA